MGCVGDINPKFSPYDKGTGTNQQLRGPEAFGLVANALLYTTYFLPRC